MEFPEARHTGTVGRLWSLPLLGGLMPAAAALAALWLSISLDLVAACNPFLDGCVSISRAARHDLPNHVFRALVLPAAALQALTWLLCANWLTGAGAPRRGLVRALPWLGLASGMFLVLYGTFLGTEGEAYRWMRRYGVIFYFGCTYLSMLVVSGVLWRLAHAGAMTPPGRIDRWLVGLCAITLAIGLAQVLVPPFLDSEDLKNRLENILEWYVALDFTLFFIALSWVWHRTRFLALWESHG